MMNEAEKVNTVYTFRDDLSEDLLDLQRTFLRVEQILERLQTSAQQLTIQKQCSLQDKVFEGKLTTHFTAQRQLLLLQDRVSSISASFCHGSLRILRDEAIEHKVF
jgi:hypothetical protein